MMLSQLSHRYHAEQVTWRSVSKQRVHRLLSLQWEQSTSDSLSAETHSKAGQRYPPTSSTGSTSSRSSSPATSSIDPQKQLKGAANAPLQTQGQTSNLLISSGMNGSLRILFGVQSSHWFTNLEQIDISSINNDPKFFRKIKLRYKKYRSWIKRIASPFRFRFCSFVKVRTYNYTNDSRKN